MESVLEVCIKKDYMFIVFDLGMLCWSICFKEIIKNGDSDLSGRCLLLFYL